MTISKKIKKFSICLVLAAIGNLALAQENLIKNAVPYRKGNKWGYADVKTGKLLARAIYDSVGRSEGSFVYPVFYRNGKMGALFTKSQDVPAKELIPAQYDFLQSYDIGYLGTKDKRYTYLDATGKIVVEGMKKIRPTGIKTPHTEVLLVEKEGEFQGAIIDAFSGKYLIKPEYNFVYPRNYDAIKSARAKTGQKLLDFFVQNAKGQVFGVSDDFALHPVDYQVPPKDKEYDRMELSSRIVPEVASDYSITRFKQTCPAADEVFKSPKNVKFKVTRSCQNGFQIILDPDNNFQGVAVMQNDKPKVLVEPIFDEIKYAELFTRPAFIGIKSGKKGLYDDNGEILAPEYDEILVSDIAYTARKGNKMKVRLQKFDKDASFEFSNVKELREQGRQNAIAIYEAVLNDGSHFYFSNEGLVFYEP